MQDETHRRADQRTSFLDDFIIDIVALRPRADRHAVACVARLDGARRATLRVVALSESTPLWSVLSSALEQAPLALRPPLDNGHVRLLMKPTGRRPGDT